MPAWSALALDVRNLCFHVDVSRTEQQVLGYVKAVTALCDIGVGLGENRLHTSLHLYGYVRPLPSGLPGFIATRILVVVGIGQYGTAALFDNRVINGRGKHDFGCRPGFTASTSSGWYGKFRNGCRLAFKAHRYRIIVILRYSLPKSVPASTSFSFAVTAAF